MQVDIYKKNIKITQRDEDYIYKVVNAITKYSKRVTDEASSIKVQVEREKLKTTSEKIFVTFTVSLPGNKTMRAENRGVTIQAAVDTIFDELKVQLERFKGKNIKRKPVGIRQEKIV